MSDYAAPYDNARVGLEISKEGYRTAYTIYIDYTDGDKGDKTQVFFVVLSPKAADEKDGAPPAAK
jgi:hypothetical protein